MCRIIFPLPGAGNTGEVRSLFHRTNLRWLTANSVFTQGTAAAPCLPTPQLHMGHSTVPGSGQCLLISRGSSLSFLLHAAHPCPSHTCLLCLSAGGREERLSCAGAHPAEPRTQPGHAGALSAAMKGCSLTRQ